MVAAVLVAAAVLVVAAAVAAASRLCLQGPLGLAPGPRALACHQAAQRGRVVGRGLSSREAGASQSPLVQVGGLCASCVVAWAVAASAGTAVSVGGASPEGAAVGSGQGGHQEDR